MGVGGEKRVKGLVTSSILLFSPVAVVRLMVGRLREGVWGEGGRKDVGCGASSREFAGLGAPVKGRLKRGLYFSLDSRVSTRMGSFSESRSGGEEGDEAKGLRVRIGMFLVLQLRLATGGLVCCRAGDQARGVVVRYKQRRRGRLWGVRVG